MIEKTWAIAEKLIIDILFLTEQLNQQLAQEADILKSAPTAGSLDVSSANKKQLVSRLEELNQHFIQILAIEKLPNDQAGINEYFQRATLVGLSTSETVNNWQQIQLICTECKNLNEQNGASIELLSLHAKRSLDILKGKKSGANVYGKDGISQSETLANTLTFYL
jgi:flagellar biosynthesis protein FlgN